MASFGVATSVLHAVTVSPINNRKHINNEELSVITLNSDLHLINDKLESRPLFSLLSALIFGQAPLAFILAPLVGVSDILRIKNVGVMRDDGNA